MNQKTNDTYDALIVGNEFWKKYSNRDKSQQHWQLFPIIIELMESDIALEAGKPEECVYDYPTLANKFAERAGEKKLLDNSRLRKLLVKLEGCLVESNILLEDIASNAGLTVVPVLERKVGGGAGNKTGVSFTTRPVIKKDKELRVQAEQALISPQTGEGIKYFVESAPRLPLWSRWLREISFEGHGLRVWLYALFVGSPFLVIALLAFLTFALSQSWITSISSGLVTCLVLYPLIYFMLFSHIIRATNNNIALLPDWMLPMRLHSAVLVYDINPCPERKLRIKSVGIKVYTANCPRCGHRVNLKSGGLRFFGRIIGVCDGNPVEHLYSFDFISSKGEKLL